MSLVVGTMWWPESPILGIRSPFSNSRNLFIGLFLGFSLSFSSVAVKQLYNLIKREKPPPQFNPRPIELRSDEIVRGVVGLIGERFYPDTGLLHLSFIEHQAILH